MFQYTQQYIQHKKMKRLKMYKSYKVLKYHCHYHPRKYPRIRCLCRLVVHRRTRLRLFLLLRLPPGWFVIRAIFTITQVSTLEPLSDTRTPSIAASCVALTNLKYHLVQFHLSSTQLQDVLLGLTNHDFRKMACANF